MDSKKGATASGTSITTVVQIVFLILKLTKLIDWSWFWVLSPTIFSAAIVVGALVVLFGVAVAKAIIERKSMKDMDRKNSKNLTRARVKTNTHSLNKTQELSSVNHANTKAVSEVKTMPVETAKKVDTQVVKPAYIRQDSPEELSKGFSRKIGFGKGNRF